MQPVSPTDTMCQRWGRKSWTKKRQIHRYTYTVHKYTDTHNTHNKQFGWVQPVSPTDTMCQRWGRKSWTKKADTQIYLGPNKNRNTIVVCKFDRIRIQILFGFDKSNEYEYYSWDHFYKPNYPPKHGKTHLRNHFWPLESVFLAIATNKTLIFSKSSNVQILKI